MILASGDEKCPCSNFSCLYISALFLYQSLQQFHKNIILGGKSWVLWSQISFDDTERNKKSN